MLRKKVGDFYLTTHIGSGGMSEVYLAKNPRTSEKRAVKVMAKRATGSPIGYARFLREVEIMRTLDHPHIVQVLDSGHLDDCYYYMMEFMPGGNLACRMDRGRLPLDEKISLFAAICDAMAYAHDKGVVHRDLKPANILMNSSGAPMVSDFGIAKVMEDAKPALTRSSEIMGTIAYLAPEQRFNTKRVDRRADVYALGAVFYEMLMGFPPLGKFPWPRDIQPDFPETLQTLLENCLALESKDRYPHAGLLLFELQKYQETSDGSKSSLGDSAARNPEQKNLPTPPESDRIEHWLHVLRAGTTRERLAVVREMVDKIEPQEASALLKLYPGEEDRVRWGLIRALGELKISAAAPMILEELRNPFQRECALEALGKIGADEAFNSILEYVLENPESALMALLPMAQTGKQRAMKVLRYYLTHEMVIFRETAVKALSAIPTLESLQVLKEQLSRERDDKVRSTLVQVIQSMDLTLVTKTGTITHMKELLPETKPA